MGKPAQVKSQKTQSHGNTRGEPKGRGVVMLLLETLPGPSVGGWEKGRRLERGRERKNKPQSAAGDSEENAATIGPWAHTAGASV